MSNEKKPRPYEMSRFGILNPYGDIWTPDTFDSPEEAEEHVAEFFKGIETDLTMFKVIPVNVTVTAANQ